jgi:hypothetical protein
MHDLANIYICGDGTHMYKDVRAMLVKILLYYGGGANAIVTATATATASTDDTSSTPATAIPPAFDNEADVIQYLQQMRLRKRLLVDIWS